MDNTIIHNRTKQGAVFSQFIESFWPIKHIDVKNKEFKSTIDAMCIMFPRLKTNKNNQNNFTNFIKCEVARMMQINDSDTNVITYKNTKIYNDMCYGLEHEDSKLCLELDSKKMELELIDKQGYVIHTLPIVQDGKKITHFETRNNNQCWCAFDYNDTDNKFNKIHIFIQGKKTDAKDVLCQGFSSDNLEVIKFFFNTFTKVLTMTELNACCLNLHKSIDKIKNALDDVTNENILTNLFIETIQTTLQQHTGIKQYLDECGVKYPSKLNIDNGINKDKRENDNSAEQPKKQIDTQEPLYTLFCFDNDIVGIKKKGGGCGCCGW